MLIGVSELAVSLGVSTRRVRKLLAQGRIAGFKVDGIRWQVRVPFTVTPGKRGPDLHRFPVRHLYGAAKPTTRGGVGADIPHPGKIAPSPSNEV